MCCTRVCYMLPGPSRCSVSIGYVVVRRQHQLVGNNQYQSTGLRYVWFAIHSDTRWVHNGDFASLKSKNKHTRALKSYVKECREGGIPNHSSPQGRRLLATLREKHIGISMLKGMEEWWGKWAIEGKTENTKNSHSKGTDEALGLFEDLALVELATLLVGATPREVLLDQLLSGVVGRIQLLPVVHLVIDLPIWRQLEGKILTTPDPHA